MNELPLNQILCGPCEELLQGFPDNSVDLVVTDPPYGLSFMGKEWDKALPSRAAFKEINRVLKPGALALVMSSPRQDLMARMILLLEDAGFKTDLSFINWIYKTGFPKAYDISKGIDKNLGTLKKLNPEFTKVRKWIRGLVKAKGLTYRQIDSALGNVNSHKASHYLDNSQPQIPTPKDWDIIKKLLDVDSDLIKEKKNLSIQLFEREVIKQYEKLNSFKDGYGVGFTEYEKTNIKVTIPASDEAKRWDGWKNQSGLKPAQEPVLMVYKPRSESTIVNNVLRWGTGAINVDATRIPFKTNETFAGYEKPFNHIREGNGHKIMGNPSEYIPKTEYSEKGRFPANLLVSDGALDTGKQSKSGTLEPHHTINGDGEGHKSGKVYGTLTKIEAKDHVTYGDIGDQSRYFDLDAWAKHHGFLDVPKPDTKERDFGLRGPKREPKSKFNKSDGKTERFDGAVSIPRRNTHPTVKPIKLMALLIELGCPKGGFVLDPFAGSGTALRVARKLGRQFIGIDINPEYVEMCKRRVRADSYSPPPEGVPTLTELLDRE